MATVDEVLRHGDTGLGTFENVDGEDESAPDDKTQKQVSEALDSMGCTRLVIAHRLSTIRHCDRILVLDGGRIIEDGTYDVLIKKGGFFAELVERQRLEAS